MQEQNIQRKNDLTIVKPHEHKNTLIWIHGLNQFHQKHLPHILRAIGVHREGLKIVIPRAPDRYVTVMQQNVSSWFDIKFRGQKSFTVPFDEAFSSAQVLESYEKILRPIIEEESKQVKKLGGKLIVSGFSQGCGMSLHCLYTTPDLVDAALGISGYLFPFTQYDPSFDQRVSVIYGLADDLRPWDFTKVTYTDKLSQKRITMVPKMKHEINKDTEQVLQKIFNDILGNAQSKL